MDIFVEYCLWLNCVALSLIRQLQTFVIKMEYVELGRNEQSAGGATKRFDTFVY